MRKKYYTIMLFFLMDISFIFALPIYVLCGDTLKLCRILINTVGQIAITLDTSYASGAQITIHPVTYTWHTAVIL